MDFKLPKHIINSLINNRTSLGEHPSLPPDEEEKFLIYLIGDYYNDLCQHGEIDDISIITEDLRTMLTRCQKLESTCIEALQTLCVNVINQIFEIPEDTLEINCSIVDNVDTSKQRVVPEKTTDFSFDDIDDMSYLTQEIYKRRILNALVMGASMYYASNIDTYVQDLFKINPELPSLYKQILDLNTKLMYLKKDTLDSQQSMDGGKVEVVISNVDNKIIINAEGVIFPILLEETIKGILEVAIAHGLPNNRTKAEYVTKKADFKLAEIWDMRIGLPLWMRIESLFDETNTFNDNNYILNFFLYELSLLPVNEFNSTLQNIFKKTRKGKDWVKKIMVEIEHKKELDDFNDFINQQSNKSYSLNDNEEYFTSEELITDSTL